MPAPADTILLYTDIVGYTRLLRADREDALDKLDEFQAQLRDQVTAHGGRVLQAQRDSCLAGFEQAADAAHCAEALQHLFQGDASIPVRMGLHAGAVVEKDGHAFGEGVVAVMQLERVGEAGSVVLSQAVQSQLPDQGEWATESLGPFDLKNREQPIELYALAGKGLTIPDRPQPEETSSDRQRWSHALKLFAGYLVAAWTVLQFVDWLLMRYQISPYWTDILLWTFVGIIPSLLIYLLHQDRINEWRLLRREKIIISLNILLLFGGLTVAYGGAELGSITRTISFTDAEGAMVTETVVKPEFMREMFVFPFEQEEGADSTNWISYALRTTLVGDMQQDKYLNLWPSSQKEEAEKINAAQSASGAHYIDGSYRVTDTGFAITPALKDKRDGSVVSKRTFRGEDFFVLVDSISIYLRQEMGLTPAQMKQSVDLEVKDWLTDNFAALRSLLLGFMNGRYTDIERSLEQDSTFALASFIYARLLHHAPRGQLEAKHYVNLAMRHRKRLTTNLQIMVMLANYLILGERDKAEKLIDLQLELDPNDATILEEAIQFSLRMENDEKLYQLLKDRDERFPSLKNKLYSLYYSLRTREATEVEKGIRQVLLEVPQNPFGQLILAQAYLHQQKYAAAKKALEEIMIMNPDKEKVLSPLYGAITYLEANPEVLDKLDRYASTARSQSYEEISFFNASRNGIWGRTDNMTGIFLYPSENNRMSGANLYDCYIAEYLENEAGEFYAVKLSHCNDTSVSHHWVQDSLFWQAEELLRAREYERATTTYAKLLIEHPEHYYLNDAQAHLNYRASKTETEIQELFQRYVGNYDGISIWIENGELFYKRPGVPRRILRPLSDTKYMTLSQYATRYAFDVEQDKVKGLYYYEYDNEAREWRRDEELYFARTQLAN